MLHSVVNSEILQDALQYDEEQEVHKNYHSYDAATGKETMPDKEQL